MYVVFRRALRHLLLLNQLFREINEIFKFLLKVY